MEHPEWMSLYTLKMSGIFSIFSHKETIYTEALDEMKSKWSAPFYDYYSKNIQPDVRSIVRWSIEQFNIYNPYSGVTTNQAESLNTVLKGLQQWQESLAHKKISILQYVANYVVFRLNPNNKIFQFGN